MKDHLKTVFRQFAKFDETELSIIADCFKPKQVAKNEIVLHEGEICTSFFFVEHGCIRTFYLDKNGREKTRYIMTDYHIGTALASFVSQKPSVECIEALEKTELLSISHTDFYELNVKMNNWKIFYQRILEMAYTFQTKKIEHLVTLSAQQRYDAVLQENPKLMQQVSNKVLASYLDIREETLSRLKSR